MKNRNTWFHFKSEAITGTQYLGRVFVGIFGLLLIVPGLWLLAATGYKRASAFNWSKSLMILSAVAVPLNAIGHLLSKDAGYMASELNAFDLISGAATILHLILLFKNGNKKQ